MGLAGLAGLSGLSGIVPGVGAVVPPEGLDPDAATFIANVEAADGQALEAAIRAAYNQFVIGCKADASPNVGVSNWAAFGAVVPMMGARTLAGALVPLKGPAPTNFNFVAGDYSRITGLKGNGTNKHIDTNKPFNEEPRLNIHCAVYVRSPDTENRTIFGCRVPGTDSGGFEARQSGFIFFNPASSGALSSSTAPLINQPTIVLFNRTSSSSYTYRVNQEDSTVSMSAGTPLSQTVTLFQRGDNVIFSNSWMMFYSIGQAVTPSLLDQRVTTLSDAIAAALA